MKIVYLHQYFKFPNENGGTRSYDLSISFIRHGYKVVVVTATSDKKHKSSARWHIEEKEKIEIHHIYLPYANHLSSLQRSLVFLKFLWFSSFHLLSINADFVLATSTPLTIGIPAIIKKWFSKTPYIFEVRDVWPEAVIAIGAIKNKLAQKELFRLERMIYKHAAAIVPLSNDMKASIDRRYPEFKFKTSVVISNISEINRFQQKGLNSNIIEKSIGFAPRFSILYAGTFGRVNGVDYVVKLAKYTLKYDPQLVYILIGEGAEKENVRLLAGKEGVLNKNLFILESVTKNELPDWYASASMGSSFVIDIPELWANSANKFFDALAASKPILINHEGWQKKEIQQNNVGFVLPTKLSDVAVREFVKYTQNRELIEKQQVNAIILAKRKYSLEKAVESYETIFQKTIANQKQA